MSQMQNKLILEKTSQLIHSQYSEHYDTASKQLSDDIAYIGPMALQWAENLSGCVKLHGQYHEPWTGVITNEEYKLHTHYRGMWIIYGRFLLTITAPDGKKSHSKMRATVIWKKNQDSLKVIHLHISAGKGEPENDSIHYNSQNPTQTESLERNGKKLAFRDCSGCYHYLYKSEILCIEADKQSSYVILPNERFRIRRQISQFERELPPGFMRTHKSYIVNLSHITDIWLYHLRLSNSQELPVSRDKYAALKQVLKN